MATIRNHGCMRPERPGYSRTVTSNPDSAGDTPDEAGQHPSDPVKPGTLTVRSPDRGKPLAMEFETLIATGKADKALVLEQAAAIREVLAWIARNREPSDDGHDPSGS